MDSMSSSIEPVPMVPRTANLLACKQWWRVCFLYGDQQKYYRQVYSKAAAQRLALSTGGVGALATGFAADNGNDDNENENENETNSGKDSGCSGSMHNADYDTVAGDFIETQLEEADANPTTAITTSTITIDAISGADMGKTRNQEVDKLLTKKKKKQKGKESDEQAPPVPLFPSKYQAHTNAATGSSTTSSPISATSRGKKLLRSLRGHVSKVSESTVGGGRSAKERHKNASDLHGSEATKGNARVTVLDDPFLFGIDADHLGDLVRGKQYAANTTEDISKYYSSYLAQEQELMVDAHNATQVDFGQHLSTAPSTPEQFSSLQYEGEDPKPALPPKKKKQSNYEALDSILKGSTESGGTSELQLNENELKLLNLSMRNRSLPRSMKPFKDVPTDISFTFTEADGYGSSPPRSTPLQKSATCERDINLGAHRSHRDCN
ncbi:PREDICTED: protein prickle-like, partial [Rhagoletis zephyria]|uniref:protein prickle-like n=1 Tax=Rhagoletis zephyria TaxID=28612 RepID=UPI0008113907